MTVEVLFAFIAACLLLGLTPGPNMSLIIANTLSTGLTAGLFTLAGTTTGLALLVGAAVMGMSSVMVFMSEWFDVLRFLGALYLVWLGARQLWQFWFAAPGAAAPPASRGNCYAQGLLVSLSNPKVMLFLGAFLPQFIDPGADAVGQLTLLAVLFVVVLAAVDVGYTLLLARARTRFSMARLRWLDGAAGVLLLLGGAVLATMRRP
ncbi:MAG TPA: LysE family translocator [Hyphomicrobiaceae bacterium]|nr:LysE family translocator [Hyphomicrobiaceae bacterium]